MIKKVLKISLFMLCIYYPSSSFAQQLIFAPRENVIFATLNQLQDKEEAMRSSLKEAQVKLVRESLAVKRSKVTFVSSIASRAHPYLTTESRNNDNVDATASDRKSSLIHTVTPGVKINLSQKNRFFTLNTYINNTYYNNRARNNSQAAGLDLLANFNIGRYSLTFSNDYFNNHIAQPHFNIKKDSSIHYWSDTFDAEVRSHYNNYDYSFSFSHAATRYEPYSNIGGDVDQDEVTLSQYLSLTPKMHLSLEYTHARSHHTYKESESTDYNSNEYILGLTKILSYKVSSALSITYKDQDFKTASDPRSVAFMGSLAYRITDHSDLNLSFEQLIHKEDERSNYWRKNAFIIGIHHRFSFNPKLAVYCDYGMDYLDYLKKDPVRYANISSCTLGLTYAYRKWLDLGLDYEYIDRYFNYFPKYENTIVIFRSQARF